MILSTEELRNIILGKTVFKKCPCCDKNGTEYWDEDGNNAGPAPRPEWGNDFCTGTCENCDGVAYVVTVNND